jgi:hypothetical protein
MHAGSANIVDCRRWQFAPTVAFRGAFAERGNQFLGSLQHRCAIAD